VHIYQKYFICLVFFSVYTNIPTRCCMVRVYLLEALPFIALEEDA
jgi:hypothetical protein